MGILKHEFLQTPRDGVADGFQHETVNPDVERSMLAYAEHARVVMSTSLPEGLSKAPRYFQRKVFFRPVTWSQKGNAQMQIQHSMVTDYSFPHFKERESMITRPDHREKPDTKDLHLFIGSNHSSSIQPLRSEAMDEAMPLPKQMSRTRKAKSRWSVSTTSFQTDWVKRKLSSENSGDLISEEKPKVCSVDKDTPDARISGSGPTNDIQNATGSCTAIAMESNVSNELIRSVSFPEILCGQPQSTSNASRLLPPNITDRKLPQIYYKLNRKHDREQRSSQQQPAYLMIGRSNTCSGLNIDKIFPTAIAGDHDEWKKVGSDATSSKETPGVCELNTADKLNAVEVTTGLQVNDASGNHNQPSGMGACRQGRGKTVMQPTVVNINPYDISKSSPNNIAVGLLSPRFHSNDKT